MKFATLAVVASVLVGCAERGSMQAGRALTPPDAPIALPTQRPPTSTDCSSTPGGSSLDPSFGTCGRITIRAGNEIFRPMWAEMSTSARILIDGGDLQFPRHLAAAVISTAAVMQTCTECSALNSESGVFTAADPNLAGGFDLIGRSTEAQPIVVRTTADGAEDAEFGAGGTATLLTSTGSLYALSSAATEDGGLVVSGAADTIDGYADGVFFYAKLTALGDPDVEFGSSGFLFDRGPGADGSSAFAVRALRSGDLVSIEYRGGTLALVRRTLTGAERWRTALPIDSCSRTIGLTADEKLVIAGVNTGTRVVYVFRFNPDGTPDAMFGDEGVASFAGVTPGTVWDQAVAADGSIIVLAWASPGLPPEEFEVFRITSSGTLDTDFAPNGVLRILHDPAPNPVRLFIDSNARIYIVGDSPLPIGAFVERLLPLATRF